MIKIAINGFGRIGRATLKVLFKKYPDIEIKAINDLTDTKTIAHILKYDSLYGTYDEDIFVKGEKIVIGEKEVVIFSEKNIANLPWKDMDIDVVLECTGVFRKYEEAKKHIEAGAKKVIISAPAKSPEIPSFVLGVNEDKYDAENDNVISMASCTTNCLAPIADVLNKKFGIEKGFMTTIHSYTSDQRILDLQHSDLRRARAAALSIIPTTTGAAKATGEVIPDLKGKIDGMAFRVPTPTVSVVDFFCQLGKETDRDEVNFAMKEASKEKKLEGILKVEDLQLVSIDYKGNTFSSIVDSNLTMVNKNLAKVISWYDNEWGYSSRLADMVKFIGEKN